MTPEPVDPPQDGALPAPGSEASASSMSAVSVEAGTGRSDPLKAPLLSPHSALHHVDSVDSITALDSAFFTLVKHPTGVYVCALPAASGQGSANKGTSATEATAASVDADVDADGAGEKVVLHRYSAQTSLGREEEATKWREPRRVAHLPWWWNPLAHLVLWAILAYQRWIPDERKRRCIFEPSCSRYCQSAIKRYGLVRGLYYFWGRFQGCNAALSQGGYDPP